MPLPISLREFANELVTFGDEWQVYFNRRTGEFISAFPDDRAAVEPGDEDKDELAPDEQKHLAQLREALVSED